MIRPFVGAALEAMGALAALVGGFFLRKRILLVLRYDDYSSLSPTKLEETLLELNHRYCVPITFGVVPCARGVDGSSDQPSDIPLTRDKAGTLRKYMDSGMLHVAMHGYSHEALGVSEFDAVAAEIQFERLSKGKRLLEELVGGKIDTFIPPWNSYDANTLRCLERLHFRCISADANGYFDEQSTLSFLPTTKQELAALRRSIALARLVPDPQPIVVLVFHEYDFTLDSAVAGKFAPEQYADLLCWINAQKDIKVISMGEVISAEHDLGVERLAANAACQKPSVLVPSFLCPKAVYLSRSAARTVAIASRAAAALLYAVVSGVAAAVSSCLCGAIDSLWIRLVCLAGGIAASALGVACLSRGWRSILALAIGVGVIAGFLHSL